MSWPEVRKKIGGTLPEFMGDEAGFPTPSNPDFWNGVLDWQEIALYLRDQIEKLALQDEETREILGQAYNLLTTGARETEDPERLFKEQKQIILSESGVYLLIKGPLRDTLLGRLGVSRLELNEDTAELLESRKDVLRNLGRGGRALLWWATAAEIIGVAGRREVVASLVELSIYPPEVM
jgi:hypothetical protein